MLYEDDSNYKKNGKFYNCPRSLFMELIVVEKCEVKRSVWLFLIKEILETNLAFLKRSKNNNIVSMSQRSRCEKVKKHVSKKLALLPKMHQLY